MERTRDAIELTRLTGVGSTLPDHCRILIKVNDIIAIVENDVGTIIQFARFNYEVKEPYDEIRRLLTSSFRKI
jgi:hypothetical protein